LIFEKRIVRARFTSWLTLKGVLSRRLGAGVWARLVGDTLKGLVTPKAGVSIKRSVVELGPRQGNRFPVRKSKVWGLWNKYFDTREC